MFNENWFWWVIYYFPQFRFGCVNEWIVWGRWPSLTVVLDFRFELFSLNSKYRFACVPKDHRQQRQYREAVGLARYIEKKHTAANNADLAKGALSWKKTVTYKYLKKIAGIGITYSKAVDHVECYTHTTKTLYDDSFIPHFCSIRY